MTVAGEDVLRTITQSPSARQRNCLRGRAHWRALFTHIPIGNDIVAQAQMVGDDGGHRLDAGHVDLAQLLDRARMPFSSPTILSASSSLIAMRESRAILFTVSLSTDMNGQLALCSRSINRQNCAFQPRFKYPVLFCANSLNAARRP